jgi:hypothetical protein
MLDELPPVSGVMLHFVLSDNSTAAIDGLADTLRSWLPEFESYTIGIQVTFTFVETYGSYVEMGNGAHWVFNDYSSLSEDFYSEYFAALGSVFFDFRQVVLYVGINEPYFHFASRDLAHVVLEREYTIFKQEVMTANFSCEFTMPLFWYDLNAFPEGFNFEEDIEPFWANYSDYIGFNLWADRWVPSQGVDSSASGYVDETLDLAEQYSSLFGKPIHINEVPAWYSSRFGGICDRVMFEPNIVCVYQLWFPDTQIQGDSWEYGLFIVNSTLPFGLIYCFDVFEKNLGALARSVDYTIYAVYAFVGVFCVVVLLKKVF